MSASLTPEPLLLTVEEVAASFKLSKRTVWRLLSAGKLPEPLRIGSIVRWKKEEIEEWVRDGCTKHPK